MLKWTIAVLALVMATGCGIPKEQHNAVLKDLEDTRIALAEAQKAHADTEEQLQGQIEGLNERITESEATVARLTAELEEANGNLLMYTSKAGSLEEALEASRTELAELRRARAQAEKRLQVYRDLAERLRSMIEAGQLAVKIREGKMLIELADNILFDPGRTDIKPDGRDALIGLAEVLRDIPDRNFLVAGHTDNVPINSQRFKSNWELSTARAVEVVKLLESNGVSAQRLAAAGYGEHDPVASNETRESRALNRRIEIVLMPNIEELPTISDDVLEGS